MNCRPILILFFIALQAFAASQQNNDATKCLRAILMESGLSQCLTTYVSDDSSFSSAIFEVQENFDSHLGVGVFVVSSGSQGRSTDSKSLTHVQQLLLYHLKLSPRCRTLIIVGNEITLLKSLIEWSYGNSLLLWSTRLLVVTELSMQNLHPVRKIFSKTNSMAVVAENHSGKKSFNLYLYLPYSLRLMKLGSWGSQQGLVFASHHRLFPNKFMRLLDGGNLTVVAEDFPPHVRVTEFPVAEEEEPPHIHSGPLIKFLELLAADINFNYTLVRPPDRSWGYLLPNGSWIGMVGMVFRQEVDFALGPFARTYERAQAIDYSWPLVGDAIQITAKRGETEVDPWAFVMPLTPTVWAGVFLSLCASVVLHILLSSPNLDSSLNTKENWKKYMRVFLQQDIGRTETYDSWERFLLGSWILTVLILLESYCGNLMSLLAVRYVPQPYQSLRAVLDDPKVTMVWEGGSAYMGYFLSAESGIFREVAESSDQGRITYMKTSQFTDTLETLVLDGDHVLIIEALTLGVLLGEQFTRTGVCNYYLSDETFMHSIFGLVAQKHSPLGEAVNERVLTITESGIYTQWLKTAVPNTTVCLNAPNKMAVKSTLSLRNFWGVFVILGSGYVTSAFVLVMEIGNRKLTRLSSALES